MPAKGPGEKIALTIHLPEELALRLNQAAAARKLPAAAVVADLLDRSLPRLQSGEPKKGKIPYA